MMAHAVFALRTEHACTYLVRAYGLYRLVPATPLHTGVLLVHLVAYDADISYLHERNDFGSS